MLCSDAICEALRPLRVKRQFARGSQQSTDAGAGASHSEAVRQSLGGGIELLGLEI